jgi:hypothetical protein
MTISCLSTNIPGKPVRITRLQPRQKEFRAANQGRQPINTRHSFHGIDGSYGSLNEHCKKNVAIWANSRASTFPISKLSIHSK